MAAIRVLIHFILLGDVRVLVVAWAGRARILKGLPRAALPIGDLVILRLIQRRVEGGLVPLIQLHQVQRVRAVAARFARPVLRLLLWRLLLVYVLL